MTHNLEKYDAARQALAKAHRVDEVRGVRDRAVALAAYARQAKDDDMIRWATEIKIRAERRVGELLRDLAASGARETRGGDRMPKKAKSSTNDFASAPTLKSLGVTKDDSSLWQKLAAIPEPEFEQRLAAAAQEKTTLTTRKVLTMAATPAPRREHVNGSPRVEDADAVEQIVDAFYFRVVRVFKSWPESSQRACIDQLRRLTDYLEGMAAQDGAESPQPSP
jgi:hypothetical protein